nr:MAG: nsp1a [Astroviridae sp.]
MLVPLRVDVLVLAAFDSLTTKAQRVSQTQGASRITGSPGTMALFDRMKQKYGNTNAWRELMACDAYQLLDMSTAYGIKDDTPYKFTAVKQGELYNIELKTTTLPTQEHQLLRAQASNQLRIRLFAAQSSQKTEENMRLRELLKEREKELQEKDKVIRHHQQEVKLLRNAIIDSKNAVTVAVRASSRTWTFACMLLLFLLLGFLAGETRALETDCTTQIEGCYFDIFKPSTRELTYTEIQHMCYGKTRTILSAHGVNMTDLLLQCEQQMAALSPKGHTQWVEEWCRETLTPRMKFAECKKRTWEQIIDEKLEPIHAVITEIKTMGIQPILNLASYAFLLATVLAEANFWLVGPILVLSWSLGIPPLFTSLATHFFPLKTFLYVPIMQMVGEEFRHWAFFAHWMTSIMYNTFVEKTYAAISHGLLMACLLPIWYYSAVFVKQFKIPLGAQLVMLAISISTTIGMKFLNSTVVITRPDGTTEKQRRVDVMKEGVKEKYLKLQSAIRGIIPEIPDKTRCILKVETQNGIGVGFRFMNEILTIGHVMGDQDVATLRWNGMGVTMHVKKRIQLFESCDELVFFKLPPEFQGMKPLRLSKLETSDYMQLLVFKDEEIATYTGWAMLDGNWISNTFQTKAGDSGAPYVDRNGRLVGIHLGTQGVVAQGYSLMQVLKQQQPVPLAPINENPTVQTPTGPTVEDIMREIDALKKQGGLIPIQQAQPDVEQLSDDIMAKVIEGTKKSHAALTAEVEKLANAVNALLNMVECQAQMIKSQEERIKKLEEPSETSILEQKKKRNQQRTERFMKIKVLTEEEYQRMLDEGWSAEEIEDAVRQLRQSAWRDYEMEEEDYEPDEILDDFLMTYQKKKPKKGQKVITCFEDAISIMQQSRKTYKCPKCKGRFQRGDRHNPKTCRLKQGENVEPKNSQRGAQRAPQ